MWWYIFPHLAFHLIRWFPKSNRLKVQVLLILLAFALLFPQIFVLSIDQTTRYCGQHLFDILVTSVVFTFCMIGFTILFTVMDPVPFEVKVVFHVFGGICFLIGLALTIFTSMAVECKINTVALYYYSLAASVMCMISAVFVAVMLPFWTINHFWFRSVLSRRNRTGICYEPVKCCSCLWHI